MMMTSFFRFLLIVAVFLSTTVLAVREEYENIHYMSTGVDPEVFVKEKIDSNEVMAFGRSYGKDNRRIKALLHELTEAMDVKVEFLEVDLMPGFDGSLVLQELEHITGKWLFPNVFIGKAHVGGHKEVDALHAVGELEDMIRQAGQDL